MTPLLIDKDKQASPEQVAKGALLDKLHYLSDYATKDKEVARSRTRELLEESPELADDPDVLDAVKLIVGAK